MNYPDYLNSATLYIDGQLALENFEIPAPALKLAVDNTPMWHNYEDTHETPRSIPLRREQRDMEAY